MDVVDDAMKWFWRLKVFESWILCLLYVSSRWTLCRLPYPKQEIELLHPMERGPI